MTDAPETIWHTIDRQGKISGSRDAHVEPCLEVSSSYIAYTRTDISQARVAELKAALEEIGHMGFDMPATLDLTDDAWRRRRTGMMQHIAREALKAKP
jgi:hypothetical protein